MASNSETMHVLQPGDRLQRDGSWLDKAGKRHTSRCVDPERAAALEEKPKKSRAKGAAKKTKKGA